MINGICYRLEVPCAMRVGGSEVATASGTDINSPDVPDNLLSVRLGARGLFLL
jgi:hypothetical protein